MVLCGKDRAENSSKALPEPKMHPEMFQKAQNTQHYSTFQRMQSEFSQNATLQPNAK